MFKIIEIAWVPLSSQVCQSYIHPEATNSSAVASAQTLRFEGGILAEIPKLPWREAGLILP
jgi:hypothetical protein